MSVHRNSPKPDDEHLIVERARHGDTNAWEELHRRHWKYLFNFVRKLCGNCVVRGHWQQPYHSLTGRLQREDIEDIVQETLKAAVSGVTHFDGRSRFRTWLSVIAKCRFRDHLRKKKRRPVFYSLDRGSLDGDGEPCQFDVVDGRPTSHQVVVASEDVKQVQDCLASLPEDLAEVVRLWSEDKLSFKEIGDLMGLPVRVVRSSFRRALEMIKSQISVGD